MQGGRQWQQEGSTREEGDREAQDVGEGRDEHLNQVHHYQLWRGIGKPRIQGREVRNI
jgi:hypothetical protein